jgi:hypothetical protein
MWKGENVHRINCEFSGIDVGGGVVITNDTASSSFVALLISLPP